MKQIVFIIDQKHVNSGNNWAESLHMIDIIKNEIQFYKNLSFKVINVDVEATTRQDTSVVGVNKFPWLRIFEDGKIIDNWDIAEGLREKHWDTWADRHGIKYTLEELNELRKSTELQNLEAERKRLEELNNEQKKLLELANNAKKSADQSNTTLLIVGGVILAFFLFK